MAIVESPTATRTIRVLLVEDYKLIRMGIRAVLNDDPQIEVIGEAETGEQGIELVKALRPDQVVLDLGLPGVDGIEVTRQIKAFDDNIKVTILTSHEVDEEVISSLAAGANAYCLKEIPSPRLLEVIKAVQEGAAWLDPKIASIAMDVFSGMPGPRPQGPAEGAPRLSEREQQVLELLVQGKSNAEIAADLFVSIHTAKAHVCNILQKLAVQDRVQAAVKAVKERMVG